MAKRKLDKGEQLALSKKITELVELNQKLLAEQPKGFSYDWIGTYNDLDRAAERLKRILHDAIF